MKICSNCQRENNDWERICVYCGTPIDIDGTATNMLNNPDFEETRMRWGTARLTSKANLILSVRGTNKTFVFVAADVEELSLGRHDPETDQSPDVDLDLFGAGEKGVSRQHAAIVRRHSALHLVDLDSANGTYLNGQKLVAQQPRVLRNGDEVRLGHLVLYIKFSELPSTDAINLPGNQADATPSDPAEASPAETTRNKPVNVAPINPVETIPTRPTELDGLLNNPAKSTQQKGDDGSGDTTPNKPIDAPSSSSAESAPPPENSPPDAPANGSSDS